MQGSTQQFARRYDTTHVTSGNGNIKTADSSPPSGTSGFAQRTAQVRASHNTATTLHENDIRHTILGIVACAKRRNHHKEVSTLEDVIKAYQAIGEAERIYRETLRRALSAGTQQVEIAKALDRTREMIRRDAMTDEQREQIRRADAERRRIQRAKTAK